MMKQIVIGVSLSEPTLIVYASRERAEKNYVDNVDIYYSPAFVMSTLVPEICVRHEMLRVFGMLTCSRA